MPNLIDFIASNKEWLFSGVGVFVLSGVVFLLRRLPLSSSGKKRPLPNSPEGNTQSSRGFRFEFADGEIAYAKLRTSYNLIHPLEFIKFFKSHDDFLKAMAPRVHARACYLLEKYPYPEAKLRREEVEQELKTALSDQYATFGLELTEITIGSFVRLSSLR